MRARRVLPVLLVLAVVAVGATGCFESKVANTTITGEITVGEGSTAQTVNPAEAASAAASTEPSHRADSTGETAIHGRERGATGEARSSGTTTGGGSGADLAAGKPSFTATCGGCHTLKDAGTKGNVGPDLDSLAPLTAERVAKQIENGGGPMPPKLLTGQDADERRRLRGVGRRQVERPVPGAPAVLQLPPGLDARAVRAVAMDLDGTVLDETFQPSARTTEAIASAEAAGIACLVATGRMFVSARRIAEQLGIRRPLVCYQGALVADPVSGEVLVHRPIEAPLAREILRAMPAEHARHSNLYIDDELYVWEENEATRRYSQVAGVEMHIVGPLADWIERPTTKIVTVGRPTRWTCCATSCSRSSAAARSSPSRCRTSSSSRRRASRRRAASRCSPTCWASRPSRRSQSATPRTTARCSTGRAAASPSRTRATCSRARPTP